MTHRVNEPIVGAMPFDLDAALVFASALAIGAALVLGLARRTGDRLRR